jgi:uncharacterized peroxidase-related enzyme
LLAWRPDRATLRDITSPPLDAGNNITKMTPSTTTSVFPINSPDTAPADARPALARLKESVGSIPNLAAAMATSPALIDAFVTLRAMFHGHSTLSRAERELVFLTNAVENGCGYCTAIHSAFALKEGASPTSVAAIRANDLPVNPREAALVEFDRALLRNRGRVDTAGVQRFVAAGFTAAQALELIAAAALSTIANYSGRLTQAPLDEFLRPHAPSGAA